MMAQNGYFPPMPTAPQMSAPQGVTQFQSKQAAPAPAQNVGAALAASMAQGAGQPVASPIQGASQAVGTMMQAYQNASPERQAQLGSIFGFGAPQVPAGSVGLF